MLSLKKRTPPSLFFAVVFCLVFLACLYYSNKETRPIVLPDKIVLTVGKSLMYYPQVGVF